ncbi:YibE/F family protein [Cytobacillus oceanisediminis]|uniref:YibE/F family protein n=1 Tax=Cytobacillus oceanisediminis TaxID=665099 RepID=UPI00203C6017|nr:YibE/F family protein [Cytobacillus oceanisediminis]MCM3392809.1 YibE/F family protein [Cytobacillus oceanisediminis]
MKNIPLKKFYLYIILAFCIAASVLFVQNNDSFYERSIAEVKAVKTHQAEEVTDIYDNEDRIYEQQIVAEITNGEEKGQQIHLSNQFSKSQAYDYEIQTGQKLFVSIKEKKAGAAELSGDILDLKRDHYIILTGWIFILILLFVGKKQGLFSIFSLAVNAVLLSYALDVYLKNPELSLLLICSVAVILFTVTSLLLVNGFNEKTYAAIIATLAATFLSLLVTYLVIWLTGGKGLRYEELQFITRPYQMVFLAGLFIGSLGAVMDVAITMSSSLFSLYEKNNSIPVQALKRSGMEVGKDIMGTMTNILFFAYISGSIPMLILYIKNDSPLGFSLSMNLSLELARALAGGIGIVITIPIGLYTTIYFINRKRAQR